MSICEYACVRWPCEYSFHAQACCRWLFLIFFFFFQKKSQQVHTMSTNDCHVSSVFSVRNSVFSLQYPSFHLVICTKSVFSVVIFYLSEKKSACTSIKISAICTYAYTLLTLFNQSDRTLYGNLFSVSWNLSSQIFFANGNFDENRQFWRCRVPHRDELQCNWVNNLIAKYDTWSQIDPFITRRSESKLILCCYCCTTNLHISGDNVSNIVVYNLKSIFLR